MRLTPRSTFGAALLALAGLVAFPLVSAQKNVLQTDSVTYCSDSKAVEVDRFSIAYHQFNQSVTFAFSLQAVEDNLNVSANIYVNAYGMDIVNETITLCSILAGVICPLPTANFTGAPLSSKRAPLCPMTLTLSRLWHLPHSYQIHRQDPLYRLYRP